VLLQIIKIFWGIWCPARQLLPEVYLTGLSRAVSFSLDYEPSSERIGLANLGIYSAN
jgi:hypothetical protein